MSRAAQLNRLNWSRRLGSALATTGHVDDDALAAWLAEAESAQRPLATVLLENRAADSKYVLEMMGQITGMPVVDPLVDMPTPEAMCLVTPDLARDLGAFGYRLDGNKLVLAFAEPPSSEDLRALAIVFERQVTAVLADPGVVERMLDLAYPNDSAAATDLTDAAAVVRIVQDASPVPASTQPSVSASGEAAPSEWSRSERLSADEQPSLDAEGPESSGHENVLTEMSEGAPMVNEQTDSAHNDLLAETWVEGGATRDEHPEAEAVYAEAEGAQNHLDELRDEADRILSESLGASRGGNGASPAPSAHATVLDDEVPLHIDDLLQHAAMAGASDLHLSAGMAPSIRINGSIRPIEGYEALGSQTIREMIFGILTQALRERFEAERELDTSHALPGVGRFRVNVFMQRSSVGAVLRAIPHTIPPFEALGLPEVVKGFTELQRGLVLVTGPTGSGKSTTLAALVDIINRTKPVHIVTVEDPIEFLHRHQHAIINQREVGQDTHSFSEALRHVLRQDPDVILVGEMRDLETISTALTAAETGHLVFATLHTQDAPQTVDRIIDVFPTGQQAQIRVQLSTTLEGVLTQQLVLSADGTGRVAVPEVMIATPAIRNLIRESKTHQIPSLMQSGGKFGMQTMDQALASLVKAGKITQAVAFARCHDEDELGRYLHS